MTTFDDLDDALLESVLKFLNSTQLRNTVCLVCKRWRKACTTRPGLWRVLEINVAWEVYHPHGPSSFLTSRSFQRPIDAGRGRGGGGSSSGRRSLRGGFMQYSECRHRSHEVTFLSRAAISRWLQPHLLHVEVLQICNTESRVSVVGHMGVSGRHDLQPTDLNDLLAALPALTELHLIRACDLLPDPSILLLEPTPSPALTITRMHGPLQAPAGPAAANPAAVTMVSLPLPLAQPSACFASNMTPLSERLRRLTLSQGGYDFSTEAGAAQAAALGELRGLQELAIEMEPATEEGLHRLPESWSSLIGLTALRLDGHQRLRRLPLWMSGSLLRLRELTLNRCGFRRLPTAALAGLPELRLVSLDKCPLGRGSAAVSLDAWWPPHDGVEGVTPGDAGTELGMWSGWGGTDRCNGSCSGGNGEGESSRGIAGLEVLQLRDCDILALPFTVTRLTNLRRLELGGNPLGDLACSSGGDSSGKMRGAALRYLKESGDRGFGQLVANTRLRHLGLERCGLGAVPLGVSELTQLTSLDLSYNAELELYGGHVVNLPDYLPQLTRLRLVSTTAGQQLWESGQNLGLRDLVLK